VADVYQSYFGSQGQSVYAEKGLLSRPFWMVEWIERLMFPIDLQIMLHNQDSDMLVMDPNNKNSVYRMDLERGKIVDEWKVHDSVNVDNIIPE
jgi:hypothetical protein